MAEPMQDQERLSHLEAAVRDAMQGQGHASGPRRQVSRPATSQRTLILVLLLVWSVIGWIWSSRPAFVFGEPATVAPSVEVEEATLRFALYLERSRVDAYVQRQGQLPPSLDAAGAVEEGVSMLRTSDGYELLGRRGASELRLSSAMRADSFLGNSLDVLRRAGEN